MLPAKIYFQNPGKGGIVPEFRINRMKYVWPGRSLSGLLPLAPKHSLLSLPREVT